jgi:CRISPR/Cas system-associated exonuclease Cas4 (RecB family)
MRPIKLTLFLVTTVQKWRPYLLGCSFKVKTDQQSLKFLLEQRVGMISLQRWLSKLLGYDFVIEYKRGKENKIADALSRKYQEPLVAEELSISLISFPAPSWFTDLKASYVQDSDTTSILAALQ